MSPNTLLNLSPKAGPEVPRPNGEASGLLSRFGPKKIRTKIFLLVTFLIVAVSIFFVTYFPQRLERRLSQDIVKTVNTATVVSALGLETEVQANNRPAIEKVLKAGCEQTNEITYAVLEDDSGLILASVNRDDAEKALFRETDDVRRPLSHGGLVRTKTPIVGNERTLANLYLGFSFKDLVKETAREKGVVTAVCLAVLFASGLFIFLFSGMITRPLALVTRTAERIAKGDMTQRAKVYTRDEAGVLARTFNSMVDGMEKAYREMEGINRSLEEMMRSRSKELEKEIFERRRVEKELRLAKEELEKKVEKRTEQLSKVNDELSGRVMETRRAEDQLQSTLERLEKALEGTVRAMSLTIEMRDLYTAGHQRRVSSLAVAIAQEMHLPSEKIEGLRLAGIIHDIGKIAMPAEILTKPTRLTKTEFQLIKDHPRIGYDILKSIQFPWPVAHIILQHHERMDGSGYPDGLLGDAILLEARILAVADVVEALSSHRPFRPALGIEKALEEIRRGRGIHYDMRVVDACIRLFKDHRYSFKQENTSAIFQ
jgi:putative nucleotidyltransferase with HDIG domain